MILFFYTLKALFSSNSPRCKKQRKSQPSFQIYFEDKSNKYCKCFKSAFYERLITYFRAVGFFVFLFCNHDGKIIETVSYLPLLKSQPLCPVPHFLHFLPFFEKRPFKKISIFGKNPVFPGLDYLSR